MLTDEPDVKGRSDMWGINDRLISDNDRQGKPRLAVNGKKPLSALPTFLGWREVLFRHSLLWVTFRQGAWLEIES